MLPVALDAEPLELVALDAEPVFGKRAAFLFTGWLTSIAAPASLPSTRAGVAVVVTVSNPIFFVSESVSVLS